LKVSLAGKWLYVLILNSRKNVGTANTHKKKKSKEKRNEIQSPEKDLLLMTS
jgi:hypothetical protein